MPVSQRLLDILACPICKVKVELKTADSGESGLKCPECKRLYPIKDDIPIMLPAEATIEEATIEEATIEDATKESAG